MQVIEYNYLQRILINYLHKIKEKIFLLQGGYIMNKQKSKLSHDLAKKMLIEGESFETIMETTHLRLKDLKRIQRNEIDPHF